MVRAGHGRGMASVNHTRPHCVNQMGNTHSKPLASRHGRGTAWARHAMCESAFNFYIVNQMSLLYLNTVQIKLLYSNYKRKVSEIPEYYTRIRVGSPRQIDAFPSRCVGSTIFSLNLPIMKVLF
jgi:hypothetical protein